MINKNLKLILLGLLVLDGICIVALVGIVLVFLTLHKPNLIAKPIPTPACVEPKLSLGTASFRIQSLARTPDGSVQVPPDTPGVAYWVEGTSPKYVFALSPTGENQNFGMSVKPGDIVTIVWADCGAETYAVTGTETVSLDLPALLDQPASGFTLFIRPTGSPAILVIHAERPELLITPIPGPTEETDSIQAEITFGESNASPDGKSYQMAITVKNTGSQPLTISPGDISLTPENGQPLAPLSVDPALPVEIAPSASLDLKIVFPMPEGKTAVFKILDFAVDLYFKLEDEPLGIEKKPAIHEWGSRISFRVLLVKTKWGAPLMAGAPLVLRGRYFKPNWKLMVDPSFKVIK